MNPQKYEPIKRTTTSTIGAILFLFAMWKIVDCLQVWDALFARIKIEQRMKGKSRYFMTWYFDAKLVLSSCHWQVWLYRTFQNHIIVYCLMTILHRVAAANCKCIGIWKQPDIMNDIMTSVTSCQNRQLVFGVSGSCGNFRQRGRTKNPNRIYKSSGRCSSGVPQRCDDDMYANTDYFTSDPFWSLVDLELEPYPHPKVPQCATRISKNKQPEVEWMGDSLPAPFSPCKIFCTGPIPLFGWNRK